jgi:plasmid maintenance system antidote protein VapI
MLSSIALDIDCDKRQVRAKALDGRTTVPAMRKLRAKGDRTKAIPPRYAEPFRTRLGKWVNDWADEHNETQTAAAAFLGMSQPHLSALISGRRSLGLSVLLELYEQTGITPDEWLGLTPEAKAASPEPDPKYIAAVAAGVADLLERHQRRRSEPPLLPPAPRDRTRKA